MSRIHILRVEVYFAVNYTSVSHYFGVVVTSVSPVLRIEVYFAVNDTSVSHYFGVVSTSVSCITSVPRYVTSVITSRSSTSVSLRSGLLRGRSILRATYYFGVALLRCPLLRVPEYFATTSRIGYVYFALLRCRVPVTSGVLRPT